MQRKAGARTIGLYLVCAHCRYTMTGGLMVRSDQLCGWVHMCKITSYFWRAVAQTHPHMQNQTVVSDKRQQRIFTTLTSTHKLAHIRNWAHTHTHKHRWKQYMRVCTHRERHTQGIDTDVLDLDTELFLYASTHHLIPYLHAQEHSAAWSS